MTTTLIENEELYTERVSGDSHSNLDACTLCLAVMYHYIRPDVAKAGCGVRGLTAGAFEGQVDRLCAQGEPIDWFRLHRWLYGEGEIPRRSFILTFDDGLKEHIDVVAPILESRDIRGVFFVATQPLMEHRPLSPHLIHVLLDRLTPEQLSREVDAWLGTHHSQFSGLTEDQNRAAQSIYHYEAAALRLLKYTLNYALGPEVRYPLLEDLFERFAGTTEDFIRDWYLSEEDVRNLRHRGHAVGGHGHAHEPFATLTASAQTSDLLKCQAWLSSQGLHGPLPFSFPYGSQNEHALERCQAAGFSAAFTTQREVIQFSADPFLLPRFDTIYVEPYLLRNASC